MKKFFKFLAGSVGLAALVGGVFYVLNKKAADTAPEDEDDFNEDFDDPFFEDDNRGYTSIPVPSESESDSDKAPEEESAPAEESPEEKTEA